MLTDTKLILPLLGPLSPTIVETVVMVEHPTVHPQLPGHTVCARALDTHGVHYVEDLSSQPTDRHVGRFLQSFKNEKEQPQQDVFQ